MPFPANCGVWFRICESHILSIPSDFKTSRHYPAGLFLNILPASAARTKSDTTGTFGSGDWFWNLTNHTF